MTRNAAAPQAPKGPHTPGTGSVELWEGNDGTLYFVPGGVGTGGEGIAIVMQPDGDFLTDARLYRDSWHPEDSPENVYPVTGEKLRLDPRDIWPGSVPAPVDLVPPGAQHVATYRGPGCDHRPDTLEVFNGPSDPVPGHAARAYLTTG